MCEGKGLEAVVKSIDTDGEGERNFSCQNLRTTKIVVPLRSHNLINKEIHEKSLLFICFAVDGGSPLVCSDTG